MTEDEINTIVYFPTDVDKQIISGLCNEIIDILEPLRMEQKAFALAQLVSSFEDVSGIKFDEIITAYNKSKEGKIKCNSCLKIKEEYVSGLCKECSDKMDKHLEGKKL